MNWKKSNKRCSGWFVFSVTVDSSTLLTINRIAFILLAIGLLSCGKDVSLDMGNAMLNLPEEPHDYSSFEIPGYLDRDLILLQDNTPLDNELDNNVVTLGRVLFYDKLLSVDQSLSCASCHQQQFGFSDTARFSVGFDGQETRRHSMALANIRYRPGATFFWDGRATSIEHQVLQPIEDPVEMNLSLDSAVARIQSTSYYPDLFEKAFGSDEVTRTKIARSLAQFTRALISVGSRYDKGMSIHGRIEDFSNFTAEENFGKALFFNPDKGFCSGCHYTDLFIMDIPRNNGLEWEVSNDLDAGFEEVTGSNLDFRKFIAPSLRNIAVRPPYMHDGRFSTLEQVVRHYSDEIHWSVSLDNHLKSSDPSKAKRFNLDDNEISAIAAFLGTLTDDEFLHDEKFSSPFQ